MVTETPARWARAKDMLFGCGVTLLGTVLLWMALTDLIPFTREMLAFSPLITLHLMGIRALGFGLACLVFAVLAFSTLLAEPIKSGRNKGQPSPLALRRFGIGLIVAVVLAAAGLFGAAISEPLVNGLLAPHGYHLCDNVDRHERHPPLRWARSAGDCF